MKKDAKRLNVIPFLFGINLLFNPKKIFFDNHNLYVYKGKKESIYPLSSILELKKTRNMINNAYLWKIILIHENETEEITFSPLNTIRNSNFSEFSTLLTTTNYKAKVPVLPYLPSKVLKKYLIGFLVLFLVGIVNMIVFSNSHQAAIDLLLHELTVVDEASGDTQTASFDENNCTLEVYGKSGKDSTRLWHHSFILKDGLPATFSVDVNDGIPGLSLGPFSATTMGENHEEWRVDTDGFYHVSLYVNHELKDSVKFRLFKEAYKETCRHCN